jgi:pimeloyl-ACP methyl ester carboxylesterase
VMVLLLGLVALGTGLGGGWLLSSVAAVPSWTRIVLVLAIAAAVCAVAKPLYERWFVWHLIHDFVFNWQHGNGWRRDYEARVDRFAAHLVTLARSSEADEIVVIGHSSGSAMAIESVARALAIDPDLGRHRAALCLLTVGACVPIVAFVPGAHRCRAAMSRLIVASSILWAEYQAPQDWMNTAGFNPVIDLGLSIPGPERFNPVIRSARFRDIMTEKTYRSILYRPFRIHFQYLMASERPGEYDYVMIVCGPISLAERVSRPEADTTVPPGHGGGMDDEEEDVILLRVPRPERGVPGA